MHQSFRYILPCACYYPSFLLLQAIYCAALLPLPDVFTMKITFLGTGSATPSRSRNVSSTAVQLPEQAALWLFDCGEATQHQILRSSLRLSHLEKVFFTHLHGDHLFGLPGLLASRSLQNGGTTPVTLYGPAGLEEYVRVSLSVSHSHPGYPIRVVTIQPGILHEDDHFTVTAFPVKHRTEAYGFVIQEKPLPGQFDVELARKMQIPAGPLYGKLKSGESILLPDGRTIDGTQLVGPPRRGRRVVLSGDTLPLPIIAEMSHQADLLIHEATFLQSEAEHALRGYHSTVESVAKTAAQAQVKLLALNHFSARYETALQMQELLREAKAIFPETILAADFMCIDVLRGDIIQKESINSSAACQKSASQN